MIAFSSVLTHLGPDTIPDDGLLGRPITILSLRNGKPQDPLHQAVEVVALLRFSSLSASKDSKSNEQQTIWNEISHDTRRVQTVPSRETSRGEGDKGPHAARPPRGKRPHQDQVLMTHFPPPKLGLISLVFFRCQAVTLTSRGETRVNPPPGIRRPNSPPRWQSCCTRSPRTVVKILCNVTTVPTKRKKQRILAGTRSS